LKKGEREIGRLSIYSFQTYENIELSMNQLITGTENMKEVGLFICKIREKLWIRSPINSQEDRKSLPLFAVCYFV